MAIFCPKCGNQMSDNAKFCMACGAKLGDYSGGGVNIKDGFVQRSQVGAASVGNVNISPNFSATVHSGEKDSCPKCGFTMRKITNEVEHEIVFNGITTILTVRAYAADAYICPKCKYKFIHSLKMKDYSKFFGDIQIGYDNCPECGHKIMRTGSGSIFSPISEHCKKCGWQGKHHAAADRWKKAIPLKKALQLAGYEILA